MLDQRASEQQVTKEIDWQNLEKQEQWARKTGPRKQKVKTAQIKVEQPTQNKEETAATPILD